MRTLYQLQNRVCLYTGGKEAESSQRVSNHDVQRGGRPGKADIPARAKYIEGLENRLGRMESLLRMSGLLTEDDAGKTDLGTLEKRLAEKASAKESGPKATESPGAPKSGASSSVPESSPRPGSTHHSHDTPRDTITTPSTVDGDKSREEVENLSEAMCSLVTNNVGETRYIGEWHVVSYVSSADFG